MIRARGTCGQSAGVDQSSASMPSRSAAAWRSQSSRQLTDLGWGPPQWSSPLEGWSWVCIGRPRQAHEHSQGVQGPVLQVRVAVMGEEDAVPLPHRWWGPHRSTRGGTGSVGTLSMSSARLQPLTKSTGMYSGSPTPRRPHSAPRRWLAARCPNPIARPPRRHGAGQPPGWPPSRP